MHPTQRPSTKSPSNFHAKNSAGTFFPHSSFDEAQGVRAYALNASPNFEGFLIPSLNYRATRRNNISPISCTPLRSWNHVIKRQITLGTTILA